MLFQLTQASRGFDQNVFIYFPGNLIFPSFWSFFTVGFWKTCYCNGINAWDAVRLKGWLIFIWNQFIQKVRVVKNFEKSKRSSYDFSFKFIEDWGWWWRSHTLILCKFYLTQMIEKISRMTFYVSSGMATW